MIDSTLRGRLDAPPDAPGIDARLLGLAFDLSGKSALMTAIAVPLFALLFSDLFIPGLGRVWHLALMANVVVAGAALWAWRRRLAIGAPSAPVWRQVYLACAILGGLAWSLGPALMAPYVHGAELALLIGILLGVCAVSVSNRAAQPVAMYAFLMTAMVPPIVATLRAGGEAGRMLAVALLACLVALVLAGRRSAGAIRGQLTTHAALHDALAEARVARAQAEATSLAKSRFLANMSHELRSPLNAVIGAAQLLKLEGGDVDAQGHWADAIHRSGKNLLDLIDDVLDISRIDAGELTLSVADFHLIDCVESALATAALAARAKGLALACIVDPQLQAWRQGDARRIRQVVLNLLGNAVKFTPTGEIVVRIEPGNGPHGVCIQISDTGVGIGAASIPSIFEPFRQADDSANRRFGGSGLGLSIVHQLVQAMGATISVQSQLGHGTSFDIEMHLPAAKLVPEAPAPLHLPVAYFEPHEPSAQALDAQLARLGCLGHRVYGSDDVRQWATALAHQPDLPWLLLAGNEPEVAAMLQGAADLMDPDHVIGMRQPNPGGRAGSGTGGGSSGSGGPPDALHLPNYIMKPVLRSVLVSRLGARRRDAVQEPMTVPAQLTAGGRPAGTVHVLVVEDDVLNQTIVCRLLSHAGCDSTAASDGAQALALLAARHFDLVLMDWQMPDMDGLEVTRRMRNGEAGERGKRIPIVALTANAFAEDRAACMAAGMDDYLSKPVLADALMATVRRWTLGASAATTGGPRLRLKGAGSISGSPWGSAGSAAGVARPLVFDPSVLAALPMVADGSEPQYAQELMAMFLESAVQALRDVDHALASGDHAKLRLVVHSLKSSSATVGALELSRLAQTHEEHLRRGLAPVQALSQLLSQAIGRLTGAVARQAGGSLPRKMSA